MKLLFIILFSITALYGCVSTIPTASSCKTLGNIEEGTYSGTCRNGLAHGKGIYYYSGGGKYEGDFIEGYRTGDGTFYYKNGNKYSGRFIKNNFDGEGYFTWRSGQTERGSFSPDGKWSATNSTSNKKSDKTCTVNSDGTITGTDGTIWQLCLYGQTYKDGACIGSPKNVSWYEAMEAARNNRFLGQKDWILPSTAFLNGSIHPKTCMHPGLDMYMRENRYSSEMKIRKNLWTADTSSESRYARITDDNFLYGLNSVYYDTNKSVSEFDKFYSTINAIFIRNSPVIDKSNFNNSLAQIKCDKNCLEERKRSPAKIDNESIKRGEEFRSGAWARSLSSGSVSGNGRLYSCKITCLGSLYATGAKATVEVRASGMSEASEQARKRADETKMCTGGGVGDHTRAWWADANCNEK